MGVGEVGEQLYEMPAAGEPACDIRELALRAAGAEVVDDTEHPHPITLTSAPGRHTTIGN